MERTAREEGQQDDKPNLHDEGTAWEVRHCCRTPTFRISLNWIIAEWSGQMASNHTERRATCPWAWSWVSLASIVNLTRSAMLPPLSRVNSTTISSSKFNLLYFHSILLHVGFQQLCEFSIAGVILHWLGQVMQLGCREIRDKKCPASGAGGRGKRMEGQPSTVQGKVDWLPKFYTPSCLIHKRNWGNKSHWDLYPA